MEFLSKSKIMCSCLIESPWYHLMLIISLWWEIINKLGRYWCNFGFIVHQIYVPKWWLLLENEFCWLGLNVASICFGGGGLEFIHYGRLDWGRWPKIGFHFNDLKIYELFCSPSSNDRRLWLWIMCYRTSLAMVALSFQGLTILFCKVGMKRF